MLKIEEVIKLYNKVQKIPYYCLKERDPDLLLKKEKGVAVKNIAYINLRAIKI